MSRDDAAALLRENAMLREEVGRLLEASRALTASHEATLRRLERHDAIRRGMCLRTTAPADAPGQGARKGLFKLMSGGATTKVERLRPADAKELLAWHRTGYSYKARALCSFDAAEVRCEDGRTFSGSLLHAAAFEGNPYTVAVLVDGLGLPVDDEDLLGRTPAHIAALEGQHYALRALLARGADPLAKDAAGQTPLSLAWFRVRTEAVLKRGWTNEDLVVILQDAVDRERETGSRDGAEPFPDPAEMTEILSWDSEAATPGNGGDAQPDGEDEAAPSNGGLGPAPAPAGDTSQPDSRSARLALAAEGAPPTPSTPRSRVARFAADGRKTPRLFKSPGASLWFGSGSARKGARTPGSAAGGDLVFTPVEAVPAPLARHPVLATRLCHLLLVRDTVRGSRSREEFDRRVFVLCTEATAAAKHLPTDAASANDATGCGSAAAASSAATSAVAALMDRAFALAFPPAAVAATVLFDPSTRRSRAFEAAISAALADLPPTDRGAWAEGVRGMSCAVGMPEGTGSPYRSQLWFAVLTVDRRGRFPAQGSPHDRERLQPRVTLEHINCPEGTGVDKSVMAAISAQVLGPTSAYAVEAVVGPLTRRQGSAVVSQWRAAINAALAVSRCDANCDASGAAIASAAERPPPASAADDSLPGVIASAVSMDASESETAAALLVAAQLARRSPHALRCPSKAGSGFCEASALHAGQAAAETLDLLKGSARFHKASELVCTDRAKMLWVEAKAHHKTNVAAAAAATGAGRGAAGSAASRPSQVLAFKHMFSPGAVPHSPAHASTAGGRRHLTPFPLSKAAAGPRRDDTGSEGTAGSIASGARSTGMGSAVSISLSARAAALRDEEGGDDAVISPDASSDGDVTSPQGVTPARDLSAVMQQAAVSPASAQTDEVAGPSDEAEPDTVVLEASAAGMFGGGAEAGELEAASQEAAVAEPAVAAVPVGGEAVGAFESGAADEWTDSTDDAWSLGAMAGLDGDAEATVEAQAAVATGSGGAGGGGSGGGTGAGAGAASSRVSLRPEEGGKPEVGEESASGTAGDDDVAVMEESVSASSMFGGPDEATGVAGDVWPADATPVATKGEESMPSPVAATAEVASPIGEVDAQDDTKAQDEAKAQDEQVGWDDGEWGGDDASEDAGDDEQDVSATMLEAASAVTSSLFQAWKDVTGEGAAPADQGGASSPGDATADRTDAGDEQAEHGEPSLSRSAEPADEGPSAASFFGEEEAGSGWTDSAFEDDSWNDPAVGQGAGAGQADEVGSAAAAAAAEEQEDAEDAEDAEEEEEEQEQEAEGEDEDEDEDKGEGEDAEPEEEEAAPASAQGWGQEEGWDQDQGWDQDDAAGSGEGATAFPPLSPSDGTTPTGTGAGGFFAAPAEARVTAAPAGQESEAVQEEGDSGGAALSSFFEDEGGADSAAGGLFSAAPAPSPEGITTQVMHAVADVMDAHEQPTASAASFFDDGAAAGTPSGLDGDDFIAPDSSDDW